MPALPGYLNDSYENGYIIRKDGSKYKTHSTISRDECELIYELVLQTKPDTSLEIGFCLGFSGCAILKAMRETGGMMHYAIDPKQSSLGSNVGIENVERLNYTNIWDFTFYCG